MPSWSTSSESGVFKDSVCDTNSIEFVLLWTFYGTFLSFDVDACLSYWRSTIRLKIIHCAPQTMGLIFIIIHCGRDTWFLTTYVNAISSGRDSWTRDERRSVGVDVVIKIYRHCKHIVANLATLLFVRAFITYIQYRYISIWWPLLRGSKHETNTRHSCGITHSETLRGNEEQNENILFSALLQVSHSIISGFFVSRSGRRQGVH